MKSYGGKTCSAMTSGGSKCQAPALAGSRLCFFHHPSKAAERRDAQASGGRQNRTKTLDDAEPDVDVRDARDILDLVSDTINDVRKGRIDPKVANAIGYLCSIQVKVVEQEKLEVKIKRLEELLERRNQEQAPSS